MSVRDDTLAKIHDLPEPLVEEVSDFVDYLIARYRRKQEDEWQIEASSIEDGDFHDYLANLEEYEELLAKGQIKWSL
jgi:hypothetical protein